MSRPVIIAGFHRSGTSLVAQLLSKAGLFVGDDLIGALPSNPYGHYEDREVVRLHDRILADNGHSWDTATEFIPHIGRRRWAEMRQFTVDRVSRHAMWGFKDPRVCLFLEPWRHLLPDMVAVVVYRDPADATYSLERRHARELALGIGPAERHRRFFDEPDLALRLWVVHNRHLLRFAQTHPEDTVVVSMDDMRLGFPLIDEMQRRWKLGLTPTHTLSVFDASATDRRDGTMHVHDRSLGAQAERTLAQLDTMAMSTIGEDRWRFRPTRTPSVP